MNSQRMSIYCIRRLDEKNKLAIFREVLAIGNGLKSDAAKKRYAELLGPILCEKCSHNQICALIFLIDDFDPHNYDE